jgi:branched-subunit amino acid aminotransferase/4-amino-4-deoxychorismate lyase
MFLNFNGEVCEEGVALLRADNRGFRYGDGLFETMLIRGGRVRLGQYHVERLLGGMQLLRLEFPGPFSLDLLEGWIAELSSRNGQEGPVRARLTVYRAGAGLYNGLDRQAGYILQTGDWGIGLERRDEGLTLGVFPDGRKAFDAYAGIKSNNYQLSTQAGMFAGEGGLDDCVLLNSWGRVAETTVANIWWVREGRVGTPPLSEGCVAGVMRRFLLEALPAAGYVVREEPIAPDGLEGVDEIFLSNAIRGVRWVRKFGGADFGCRLSAVIREEIIQKI